MNKALLVFWPEKGNVDSVGDKIIKAFEEFEIKKVSILNLNKELLEEYDNWIIGGSTVGSHVWEDADDSNRWFEFFKLLNQVDLTKKVVAFYGLGDQILYPHHYVDGLGVFMEEFEKRNANIVGQWSTEGYQFYDSDGMKDGKFFGLALDEDHQPEKTDERISGWITLIRKDFK
ncbi:MAG TPA: flavodoxin domain-containing protein [Bacteroidales bacterium]|nr:flavodoxin domain-containing protein [Bacteroidales bacterium]HPE56237.1 flavodoxin domain-containing protein [Bacteroidales bacterium]HRX98212.1 flavodoxin domain-containing protein [Bacteroidales bacterium]